MLASGPKLVFFTREWRCRTDSTFSIRENCKGKLFLGSNVLDPLMYCKKKRLTLVSFVYLSVYLFWACVVLLIYIITASISYDFTANKIYTERDISLK